MYRNANRRFDFKKVRVFYNDICFGINTAAINYEHYQGIGDTDKYKLESKLDFSKMRCLEKRGIRGNDDQVKSTICMFDLAWGSIHSIFDGSIIFA